MKSKGREAKSGSESASIVAYRVLWPADLSLSTIVCITLPLSLRYES